jgi:hypothetical protein
VTIDLTILLPYSGPMDPEDRPKPTGRSEDVSLGALTGCLFPWDGLQPVLIGMPGSSHLYLPLFHSEEALREVLAQGNVAFRSIKQVVEGNEFYASIRKRKQLPENGEIKVIVDPYYLPNGRLRFVELQDLLN